MQQQQDPSQTAGDTLYYDGACPLCSKEINKLKSLDRGNLRCVDLNDDNYRSEGHRSATSEILEKSDDSTPPQPSKEAMMRRLHLQTEDGTWLVGLKANIYAWRNTRYAKLWQILALPVIFPVANAAYEFWAWQRLKK